MNRVFIAGYLRGEPEFHESQKGTSFYVVKIVTVRYFKDEAHEDVIEVTCFGKSAKVAEQYLVDGIRVVMEGRISSRAYKDRNYLSITAETITPVEAFGGAEPKKKTELAVEELSLEDDDIPFA